MTSAQARKLVRGEMVLVDDQIGQVVFYDAYGTICIEYDDGTQQYFDARGGYEAIQAAASLVAGRWQPKEF